MPNRINSAMVDEYRQRFGDGPDCVAVDLDRLTVAEAEEFRNAARDKGIEVFVVKTSLARLALREAVPSDGLEQVLTGSTALLWGGEGMPQVARLIDDHGKKLGKLKVRGGVFEKDVITSDEVNRFKDIPDRPTLLAQTLSAIIAPMTGTLAAVNSLLSSPAALTDALIKKQEEQGEV